MDNRELEIPDLSRVIQGQPIGEGARDPAKSSKAHEGAAERQVEPERSCSDARFISVEDLLKKLDAQREDPYCPTLEEVWEDL